MFFSLIKFLKNIFYHIDILFKIDSIRKWITICILKKKDKINVIFIATYSSQWKYQMVYDKLKQNSRFNVIILLAPIRGREDSLDYYEMRQFFDKNGIQYIDFISLEEENKNIRKTLKPDILFYVQPYYHMYDKRIDSHSFKDKLICYAPYFFSCYNLGWDYNLEFHNRAWNLFLTTDVDKILSQKYSLNKGYNVNVVGYLNYDLYKRSTPNDKVWKEQPIPQKRIIWSPHFTITSDLSLNQSNFLSMAQYMLELAVEYKDKVQFSFKPHPELKRILYMNKDWGKEKTDEYYSEWEIRSNTQYDRGSFIDLFLTSDGMINDSGSFTAEYMYTLKPAINCFRNLSETIKKMSVVGQDAINAQYYGTTKEEIRYFLDNVILGCSDIKKDLRVSYYNKYLLPPNESYVADNICKVIIDSL